jgi:hypothetical protein
MDSSTRQWFHCGQKLGAICEIWSASPVRYFLSYEERHTVDCYFDHLEYQLYVEGAFKNNDAWKFHLYLEEVNQKILDIYKNVLG